MIEIRRANDRGHGEHGWLNSRHTFSFASYHDRRFMGFGHLRVINQDQVAPGGGFPTHSHANMEIISYVVDGALEHRDTLGTGSVIRPGEVQLMSAGRGIAHSEMNHSSTDGVEFLQIWVLPARASTQPRYAQHDFGDKQGLVLVVSPDGRDDSLTIGQDMDIYRARLAESSTHELTLQRDRAWVQVVRGTLDVDGARLYPGDGASFTDLAVLTLHAQSDVEALIFDLL